MYSPTSKLGKFSFLVFYFIFFLYIFFAPGYPFVIGYSCSHSRQQCEEKRKTFIQDVLKEKCVSPTNISKTCKAFYDISFTTELYSVHENNCLCFLTFYRRVRYSRSAFVSFISSSFLLMLCLTGLGICCQHLINFRCETIRYEIIQRAFSY